MNVLPDVWAAGLAVAFCGSAVGSASARRRAYYAGPGNAFWPTLFEDGLTSLVLPSPSGAARRFWGKGPWRKLARIRIAAEPS